jgi:cellulose synthase/poly-beta-1,6-N-acetylglucosamine synthase-like glycosyltransferase
MIIFLIITIVLFVFYSLLLVYFWFAWRSIPDFIFSEINSPVKISVIVSARNEELNIGNLLTALQNQSYPQNFYEVILIDDNSTDGTAEIVKQFPFVRLIQLNLENINSYKKKAIEEGIKAAQGGLIITTDADCIPSSKWIENIAAFKEKNHSAFIAAPVILKNNSSILQIFQSLDFLILQGITGASVHKNFLPMCNGANLAYEKKVFFEVDGFNDIDKIASGDDMLLMHKIRKKFPGKIHYLKSKDAIVSTQPMQTWKDFFNQRIRWASKAKHYNDKKIFLILLLVYLFNLSFLMLIIAAFWHPILWLWLLGLWISKTIVELPFVIVVATFFKKLSLVKYFFIFQPLHIIYTIIAGWLGQFGKYEWKGRKVR